MSYPWEDFKYEGNIDIFNRPEVPMPNGQTATVRSISVTGNDGKVYLIPTVSPDGKILDTDEAVDLAFSTEQNLGVFDTVEEADEAAEMLHQQQAAMLDQNKQSTMEFAPYDASSADARQDLKTLAEKHKTVTRPLAIGTATGLGALAGGGITPMSAVTGPLAGSTAAQGYDMLFGTAPPEPTDFSQQEVEPTLTGAIAKGAENAWQDRDSVIESYITWPKQMVEGIAPVALSGDPEQYKTLGKEFYRAMAAPTGIMGDEEMRKYFQQDLPGSLEAIVGGGFGLAYGAPAVAKKARNLGERGSFSNKPLYSQAKNAVEEGPSVFEEVKPTPDVQLEGRPEKVIKHPETGEVIKTIPAKEGKVVPGQPGKSPVQVLEEYLNKNQVKADELEDLGIREWAAEKQAKHKALMEARPQLEKDFAENTEKIAINEQFIDRLKTEGDFDGIGAVEKRIEKLSELTEQRRQRNKQIQEQINKPFALTKEEIAEFIDNEGWEIEDVQWGHNPNREKTLNQKQKLNKEFQEALDQLREIDAPTNIQWMLNQDYDSLLLAQQKAVDAWKKMDELFPETMSAYVDEPYQPPAFSNYTEPGGENYTELFVTAKKPSINASPSWRDGHTHYDEIENPVVRLRMTDRNIDGKNMLFIEEMQGPSGDKKGYRIYDNNRKEFVSDPYDTREKAEATVKRHDGNGSYSVKAAYEGEAGKMPESLRKRIYDIGTKRAISYAKEHGYDGVAWTTGDMQVNRYKEALREKVEELEYNPDTGDLVGYRSNRPVIKENTPPDKLHTVVGKGMAEKLLSEDSSKRLEGVFYDDDGKITVEEGQVIDNNDGTTTTIKIGEEGEWLAEQMGDDSGRMVEVIEAKDPNTLAEFIYGDPKDNTRTIKGEDITISAKWPSELYGNFAKVDGTNTLTFNESAIIPSKVKRYGKEGVEAKRFTDPEGININVTGLDKQLIEIYFPVRQQRVISRLVDDGYSVDDLPEVVRKFETGELDRNDFPGIAGNSEFSRFKQYVNEFAEERGKNKSELFDDNVERVPSTPVTDKTPSSFPLYDMIGAVTDHVKSEIKKNGKTKTALKYGVPPAALTAYLRAKDDDERAELLKGPLAATMVPFMGMFGLPKSAAINPSKTEFSRILRDAKKSAKEAGVDASHNVRFVEGDKGTTVIGSAHDILHDELVKMLPEGEVPTDQGFFNNTNEFNINQLLDNQMSSKPWEDFQ